MNPFTHKPKQQLIRKKNKRRINKNLTHFQAGVLTLSSKKGRAERYFQEVSEIKKLYNHMHKDKYTHCPNVRQHVSSGKTKL